MSKREYSCRYLRIWAADKNALFPAEIFSLGKCVDKVRRQSSAGSVMRFCSSCPSVPKSRHQDHALVRGQHQGRHTMP